MSEATCRGVVQPVRLSQLSRLDTQAAYTVNVQAYLGGLRTF